MADCILHSITHMYVNMRIPGIHLAPGLRARMEDLLGPLVILYTKIYQNLRNEGSLVSMISCRTYIVNSMSRLPELLIRSSPRVHLSDALELSETQTLSLAEPEAERRVSPSQASIS